MSRRYNSDNEEEDSFEKEYLNIFKNDFLDDDEADDDYNVVEDILTHKYNYDEKPYSLCIPKKEVNDVINDANLQDNLDIFSDKENEYHFLSRKTTSPCSPVRMLQVSIISLTKIRPSPTSPVCAVRIITLMVESTNCSRHTILIATRSITSVEYWTPR